MKKQNAGITLIALVITIIILLILAGVTIATLTGQNGILTQTKQAKELSEIAEEKERVALVIDDLKIERYQNKEVDEPRFQKMVDGGFGTGKAIGTKNDPNYIITVNKTGNMYEIDDEGNIEELGNNKDLNPDQNPGILEGDGTEENPYAINSIEDLVAFSYTVNSGTDSYEGKIVTLGRSLYFNGLFHSYANENAKYGKTENGYVPDETASTSIKELVTTGEGFRPIGKGKNQNFKGNFDGKEHYLEAIYSKADTYGGLFGYIDTKIKISNLGIRRGNITGNDPTGSFIGQLTKGIEIENCYNQCIIIGKNVVGGLIGFIYADENIKITNCYNAGMLEGRNYIGGIVGFITGDTEIYINNCYNIAKIRTSDSNRGGIVGEISTSKNITISNCYNNENIGENSNSYNYNGGIIGQLRTSQKVEIKDCSNNGIIKGGNSGGIIGSLMNAQNTIITNSNNKNNIEGKMMAGGIIGNNRSQETKLEKCFNQGSIYGNDNPALGGLIAQSNEFTTIINCYNEGIIEGNGAQGGIVGTGSSIEIKNCYNAGEIKGESYSGGIVGIGNGILDNCYNIGNITNNSSYGTGGIIGVTSSITDIKKCNNKGLINVQKGPVGGIVGYCKSEKSNIYNCYNTGKIYGKRVPTGGIVGVGSNAKVFNCYNLEEINAENGIAGGIAGSNSNVSNCYNLADIYGKDTSTGGIIGNTNTDIINCYNAGTINGQVETELGIATGGIAAYITAKISNCYNIGIVNGNEAPTGGIVGSLSGDITKCYNRGKINNGKSLTGGIIGIQSRGNVNDCYNTGDILGEDISITGEITATGTVSPDCFYQIKPNNANANGATGKTEEEMKTIMDIQKFVNEMNAKVEENNSNPDNIPWLKWKLENGIPIFEQ